MSSNNRRIQRVPALLIAEEDWMKNDYYPKVASIGPYHYGKPELAQVEAFKPVAVDLLVDGEKDIFYQEVLAMIGQVRNCYEMGSVDKFSDADLAKMMLRDASLIIAEMEIYSDLEPGKTYHKRKAMIDHIGRLTGALLFRDFILVENQIPLYVIQLLIELRHGADKGIEMINNYMNKCIFGEIRPIVKSSRVPLHLLEVMHIIFLYDCVKTKESSRGSYSTGDIDMELMDEESSRGSFSTGDIEEGCSGKSGGDIEEGCSGKSGGDPEYPTMAPNHTLMLGSHKHATETSNRAANQESSRGLYSIGGIQLMAANQGIETAAKKVTQWFRKVMEHKARGIHFRLSATQSLLSNKAETSNQAKKVKVSHLFHVMKLKASGIHFRPSATQSLLDVGFKSGFFYATLQLPEMIVSRYSKPFFQNLVAYELLPGVETEPIVTWYINLMQSLVERPGDLEELRERNIVCNQVGSDEEALNVIKDINTYGESDGGLYFEVREKIQEHYNNRINTWIAELIHTHFRSPWTFIAFLAAAAVIALTAAQLYYGVHPVVDKTPTSS